jgi:glycosyltransferase involved in cell wall biosynthesis
MLEFATCFSPKMSERPNISRVVLIDTSPEDQRGSMARYSQMAMLALSNYEEEFQVSRLRLALPNRIIAKFPGRIRNWTHHLWIMLTARVRSLLCRAEIFHILDGSHAYVARLLSRRHVVVTSHDVIPVLQLMGGLGAARPSRTGAWLIRRSIEGLRQADRIIAVSENTASDLARFAGISSEKVNVVHPAVWSDRSGRGKLPSFHERRSRIDAYALHVGNNAFYKNRTGVVKIFSRIRKKCGIRLVMAGPSPSSDLREIIEEKGLVEAVDFIVDPDDSRLADLYKNACLFLFPSLYEGFGWPPLEAMAYGCPVVCSDAASLPEVVGDASLTCPPDDEQQFAEKCIAVLENGELASELAKKGLEQAGMFTLERMGRDLAAVYYEELKKSEGFGNTRARLRDRPKN